MATLIISAVNLSIGREQTKCKSGFAYFVQTAFADTEQPNTDDCVSDPNFDCEALHPTDPTKDKKRENAKWE